MKQILRNGCLFLLSALLITSLVPASAYATFPGDNGVINAKEYYRWDTDGCTTDPSQLGQTFFNPDLTDREVLSLADDVKVGKLAWSPDGGLFAFDTEFDYAVGIANADGSSIAGPDGGYFMPLSTIDGYDLTADNLSWLPDGITIGLSNNYGALYTQRLDEPFARYAGSGPFPDLKWSPTGAYIAFNKIGTGHPHYDQVAISRPNGSDTQLLTPGSDTRMAHDPDWSPDGTKLVFASTLTQPPETSQWTTPYQIFTMNRDGNSVTPITNDFNYRYEKPIWSPDGTKILAIKTQSTAGNKPMKLVIINIADGTELHEYSPVCNTGFESLGWQSIGNTIVYRMANWKTKERLFTANKSEALSVPDGENGWVLEGAAFTIPDEDTPGVTPIYRLANWKTKERLFTSSPAERDYALAHYEGWVSEGTSFHASPTSNTDLIPIYRLANWKTKERLFTSSAHERDYAVAHYDGWVSEGVAFYVPSN